jgi:hypothetical protein
MTQLAEMLRQQVETWEKLGFPCIMQRYVLKHGREFAGQKRPKGVRVGPKKQCFRNAASRAIYEARWKTTHYYEGYVIHRDMPIMPIHHAWTVEDDWLVDVTLRKPEEYEYMGVHFPYDVLGSELVRNGVYGLMDTGVPNLDLLRRLDPVLFEQCVAIRPTLTQYVDALIAKSKH